MNTQTGQIYRGEEAIDRAILRGEPIVEVSPLVADYMELGQRTAKIETPEFREQVRVVFEEIGRRQATKTAAERLREIGLVPATEPYP